MSYRLDLSPSMRIGGGLLMGEFIGNRLGVLVGRVSEPHAFAGRVVRYFAA